MCAHTVECMHNVSYFVCMYLCECKIGMSVLVQALSHGWPRCLSAGLDTVLPETFRIPRSLPELLPDAQHMAEGI